MPLESLMVSNNFCYIFSLAIRRKFLLFKSMFTGSSRLNFLARDIKSLVLTGIGCHELGSELVTLTRPKFCIASRTELIFLSGSYGFY